MMNLRLFLLLVGCVVISFPLTGQLSEAAFRDPAPEFRPKTWLHVMSENMSAEGMTKDLEAIAEVGIGGVLVFNVTQGIPVGDVKFNSEEHTRIMAHAAAECQRLGLTFGLHNCDGWSSSGGPWNTPENAMKRVVWADTVIAGGEVNLPLPQPPVTGGFYEEITTLAWPARDFEVADQQARASVTSSQTGADLTALTDGLPGDYVRFEGKKSDTVWVQMSYEQPFTVRSFYAFGNTKFKAHLQYSEDGERWVTFESPITRGVGKHRYAIGATTFAITARHFRFVNIGGMDLRELEFSSTPLMPDWLGRSAVARSDDRQITPLLAPLEPSAIDRAQMIDLSAEVVDGRLTATLPAGDWTVMRFGHTYTGAVNIPASATGTGPEVDKFRRAPLKIHYDAYVGKVVRASPTGSVGYVEIDSYEVGGQNWTQGFQDTFQRAFGYDIRPWLPVYAGRLVGTPTETERVQGDLRNLFARLANDNYYGYFTELARADGLRTYIEPYGIGSLDNISAGGRADIPMGEFWLKRNSSRHGDAVSAGHVYGKNIISAEAFTAFGWAGNWAVHPAEMVPDNDYNWAVGFNEYVFHRFAHQPNTEVTPGMTMNKWGTHYDRTQTWWTNAGKAFNEYITRGQYLLRQGVPVADVLVFVGDGSPHSSINRGALGLPWQVNYDCISGEALRERVGADAGAMQLPNGATYQTLILRNSDRMSMATLRKIESLAQAGVTILGAPPTTLIGYQPGAQARNTFKELSQAIWALANVRELPQTLTPSDLLNGAPDLDVAGSEDFAYTHRKSADSDIYFIHNSAERETLVDAAFRLEGSAPQLWDAQTGEVRKAGKYFTRGGRVHLSFRMPAQGGVFVVFPKGTKAPADQEWVNAQTAIYLDEQNRQYILAQPHEGYLIGSMDGRSESFTGGPMPEPIALNDWSIRFNANGGYGGKRVAVGLFDWKDHALDSIRYFSGTAIYTSTVDVPADYLGANKRVTLDLGDVQIAAEVSVNGQPVRTLWKPPYRLDVTDYVSVGANTLEIAVTNTWANRLIGDERYPKHDGGYELERYHNGNNVTTPMVDWYKNNEPLPPGPRTTFSTADFYSKDDPLVPSGLLGPVRLVPAVQLYLHPR